MTNPITRIVLAICSSLAIGFALLASGALNASPAASESGAGPCPTIEFFHRDGCPHCAKAFLFLNDFQSRHPKIQILDYDVERSDTALARFEAVNDAAGVVIPGVPLFFICGRVVVGFDDSETTGRSIEALVELNQIQASRRLPPGDAVTGSFDSAPVTSWLGTLDDQELGLPLFTVALGLLDGFNPCAMWVLLFLLSLLVNLKDRRRIALIAGVFVVTSGAVYFAFMAAWLNMFLIIGFSRPLQVTVGTVAILIGLIHIKTFLAPASGFDLSIPEHAKPGLYARARRVLQAENLFGALLGTVILAVVVNLIELMCTAGLPAVYTQVLTRHGLSTSQYYSYLLLYNLAYMFDDAVMVGITVYTLTRHKLQQSQGRWLKLIGGIVVLGLGIMLIVAPHALS
ncbi:MAG: glutaredoxin family protein [Burkholderiaceae bacterium]